jgi:hypothetical protein
MTQIILHIQNKSKKCGYSKEKLRLCYIECVVLAYCLNYLTNKKPYSCISHLKVYELFNNTQLNLDHSELYSCRCNTLFEMSASNTNLSAFYDDTYTHIKKQIDTLWSDNPNKKLNGSNTKYKSKETDLYYRTFYSNLILQNINKDKPK